MNGKIITILVSLLVLLVVFTGNSIAGGDNNCNTNGEDGNYDENNNTSSENDPFPGEDDQHRSGVVWD